MRTPSHLPRGPIHRLAAQGPVGTRGGVGWMRGPGACPGGLTSGLGSLRLPGLIPTRTSTRPPPISASTPCPYRTQADLPNHSPSRSAKFIRGEGGEEWLGRPSPGSVSKFCYLIGLLHAWSAGLLVKFSPFP